MSGGSTGKRNSPEGEDFSKRFAEFLRIEEAVDELSLQRAERARRQAGERLDLVLTRLGIVGEIDMARLSARFLGLPFLAAADFPETLLEVPELEPAFLRSRLLLPVSESSDGLLVAAADPFDAEPLAALSYLVGRRVALCVATEGDIVRALERQHGAPKSGRASVATSASPDERAREEDVRRLAELASEAPVIRLVQDIVARAIEEQASDIHLEPHEAGLRVRLRIDGLLHDAETLPAAVSAAVVSRVKIMSELDIAERRLPQDGRVKVNVRGREVDLRASTMPTLLGESVVLRILDRAAVTLDLAALGFSPRTVESFGRLIEAPNGLVLVTGPTGSGKTTTLYAAMSRLNEPHRKAFTVENPIEYQLSRVNQVQVLPRIGLTFASALRSILRQDPDVIMVGEVRDLETAEMAVQSALTGHLVLSTVHTNGAAATVVRLLEMGVEDYLLASTVRGILAQRLVRRLCDACAVPSAPSIVLESCLARIPGGRSRLDSAVAVRAPVGCPKCRNTGYRGRICVSELLVVTDPVRAAIVAGGRESAVEAAAAEAGMTSMLDDGLSKVLEGVTTIDEVLKVTRAE